MELAAVSHSQDLMATAMRQGGETSPEAVAAAEDRKLRECCKQFEAILWQQMLENSAKPMFSKEENASDPTGTYGYFLSRTLGESISGGHGSFSSLLHSQLSSQINRGESAAPKG